MAVRTVLSTWQEQPIQNQTLSNAGVTGFQRSFKDTYTHLKTFLDGTDTGDTLSDDSNHVITGAQLSRNPGDMGTLTISLGPYETYSEQEGAETSQVALDETWTLKSVRNDKSLLAYCGPSVSNNPQRTDVEAWLKEPDGSVAARDTYTKSDGSEATLSQKTRDLIAKYKAGHESVMRFYPMLTKTRTYTMMPSSFYEHLAEINTPSVGSATTSKKIKKPNNLSDIISGHSWLKCQDDCEQTGDGKFKRIESWIGAKSGEESWDANLYGTGTNRWEFPYGG